MNHYPTLAKLLHYPDSELESNMNNVTSLLESHYPDSMEIIAPFNEFLKNFNLHQQQEYYIKTFDVNALCYLDIGYILFGEDYKRGEFLVNLTNEHQKANNDCGSELADHLPNLLRLFDKSEDKKMVEELAYCLTVPALREMLKSFKNESNVYRNVLLLIIAILEKDFKDCKVDQFHISNVGKNCFSGKSSKKNHTCGINKRMNQGVVSNPLQ